MIPPQQALEEAVNVLHRTKPYQLEHWLADHIECLDRVLVEQPERQSDANFNDELSRYKALHDKVVNYRTLCSSPSTA